VLGFSASPALAFKNIEGCDIVTFAAKDAPIAVPKERWHRDQSETILTVAPGAEATLTEWRAVANKLIEAQRNLLEPAIETKPYQDYLAGENCLALAKLDSGARGSARGGGPIGAGGGRNRVAVGHAKPPGRKLTISSARRASARAG
jgi:hypothetical protein